MKLLPAYLDFMKPSNHVQHNRFIDKLHLSHWKNFACGVAQGSALCPRLFIIFIIDICIIILVKQ